MLAAVKTLASASYASGAPQDLSPASRTEAAHPQAPRPRHENTFERTSTRPLPDAVTGRRATTVSDDTRYGSSGVWGARANFDATQRNIAASSLEALDIKTKP